MNRSRPVSAARGFSLIELMVALLLGLLLSVGIISLFGNTSRTNKLQDSLARLQENGRFAVTRMEADMRMLGAQYCSNLSNVAVASDGSTAPVPGPRAPMVYAPELGWADFAGKQSVDVYGTPSDDAATSAYELGQHLFVRGYSCSGNDCTPELSTGTGEIPSAGLEVGKRVPGSDVLTIRYQRGSGWPLVDNASCNNPAVSGNKIKVAPQTGDDPVSRMQPGLALVSDCLNSSVVPISAVSATDNEFTIGPGVLGNAANVCNANSVSDKRVFNFSDDFVTVSYYLAFREDMNGGRLNSAESVRLIPTLIRRENGVDNEIVQGVDQLGFQFGVLDGGGNTRFMSAAEVEAGAGVPCTGDTHDGCLWRSVRTVEAHLLMNTVDEVFGLDPVSRKYRFMGSETTPVDDSTLPSGLKAGSQIRREFIAYISNRNFNF